ncbi:hypothetical protein [Burkholderia vietnamiensis]|uniref:hypothetical protein n=1 Tax=Burkholderia vietnamiensis TaxID=60552 RepID=UPI0015943540|nr:hypothetical protein [Burkholderia vietnamiensis]
MRIVRDGAMPHFVFHQFPTGEAIFSLDEYASVLSHGHALVSQGLKTGLGEYAVAYGTYIAQKGVDQQTARADALRCRGFGLGYLFGKTVEMLELIDVELYAADRKAPGLPFSALVRLDGCALHVLRSQAAVLAAFLRYRNLDAATNIANRPGVFALRSLGDALHESERRRWRELVDRTQVVRAARGVIC